MSELPDKYDLAQCERFLRELGASASPVLPIAEAALALASFDRPRVPLARYSRHLRSLVQDVRRRAAGAASLSARAAALNEIVLLKHGYSGDELTYDDLQNANLMQVIDRRKGLPVALGVLYLAAGGGPPGEAPTATRRARPGHHRLRTAAPCRGALVDP